VQQALLAAAVQDAPGAVVGGLPNVGAGAIVLAGFLGRGFGLMIGTITELRKNRVMRSSHWLDRAVVTSMVLLLSVMWKRAVIQHGSQYP
jgi:hypothetical protein